MISLRTHSNGNKRSAMWHRGKAKSHDFLLSFSTRALFPRGSWLAPISDEKCEIHSQDPMNLAMTRISDSHFAAKIPLKVRICACFQR